MKKILLSLLTIIMVSVLAIGATRAVWSDEVPVDDITFGSGNADLAIGDAVGGPWSDSRGSGWWTGVNMAPGEELDTRFFWLKNESSATLDFQTYVRIENLTGNTGDFANYMELKFEWYKDGVGWDDTGWKSLASWRDTYSGWNSGKGWNMNVVGPGTNDPREYRAYLRLRADTPNEHQDKSLTFDVIFNGTQVTP